MDDVADDESWTGSEEEDASKVRYTLSNEILVVVPVPVQLLDK